MYYKQDFHKSSQAPIMTKTESKSSSSNTNNPNLSALQKVLLSQNVEKKKQVLNMM
jgi:hypothetical protein